MWGTQETGKKACIIRVIYTCAPLELLAEGTKAVPAADKQSKFAILIRATVLLVPLELLAEYAQ